MQISNTIAQEIHTKCISPISHRAKKLSYQWSFGDGNTSTKKNPNHTYSTFGSYNVKLIISDTGTCADTLTQTIVLNNPSCAAFFQLAIDTLTSFTVFAIENSIGSGLSYTWYFGDGDSSNSQTPVHTYTSHGQFILCLKVENNNCSDTYCDTFSIDSLGNFNFKKGFKGFKLVVITNDEVGINPTTSTPIELYPNPVTNVLMVDGITTTDQLSVTGLDGKTIDCPNQLLSNQKASIDMSGLHQGIYFIKLQNPTATRLFKVVKY